MMTNAGDDDVAFFFVVVVSRVAVTPRVMLMFFLLFWRYALGEFSLTPQCQVFGGVEKPVGMKRAD